MNIFELYKIHINPEVTGSEFHRFSSKWGIHGLIVQNPNPEIYKMQLELEELKRNEAIKWILKNSKL